MANKCTKDYDARAQLMFCFSNLLFGDALVAWRRRRVLRKVIILETLSTRTGGGDGDGTSAYRLRRDRRRVSLVQAC